MLVGRFLLANSISLAILFSASQLYAQQQRAVSFTGDGGLNSTTADSSGATGIFGNNTSTQNPYENIMNPEGNVLDTVNSATGSLGGGGSGVTGLKSLKIFGDTLSPKNRMNVSGIDKYNDPLIGSQPDIPPAMVSVIGATARSSSAVTRAATGGNSIYSKMDPSESFAGGAVGTMYNYTEVIKDQQLSNSLAPINSPLSVTMFALTATDPAAADSAKYAGNMGIGVVQGLNQASNNMYQQWQDQPYGKLRQQSFQACLNKQKSAGSGAPMLKCMEEFNGSNAFGSGLGGLSNALSSFGFGEIASLLNAVSTGNYGSFLQSMGVPVSEINGMAGGIKGFTDMLSKYNKGDLAKIANMGNGGDFDGILKSVGLSNVSGLTGDMFKGSGTDTTNAPKAIPVDEAAKTRSFARDGSALSRLSLPGGLTGGSGGSICGSLANQIPSDGQCSLPSSVSISGSVKFGIRNSYFIFPEGDSQNKTRRQDYNKYFGDQCIVCVAGGTDDNGTSLDNTTERLFVVSLEQSEAKYKPDEYFKEINRHVYESLRGTLHSKCVHDNKIVDSAATAQGAAILRLDGTSGKVKDEYEDGDFWRSASAFSQVPEDSSDLTPHEVLRYLSFPGFRLRAGDIDGVYSIISSKNPISEATYGVSTLNNHECDSKLGGVGTFGWDMIINSFNDPKRAAALSREIKALVALSQRISLGKVYDSCNQALAAVQEVNAIPEMTHAASKGILNVCAGPGADYNALQARINENVMSLNQMMDRMYAEIAAGSGKSGSAIAKSFKGEKAEAKSQLN